MTDIISRLFETLADRYRIEREIGSGGMATVYLARDLKHDRDVALKVFRPELAAVLGAERFLNEIKISARLDHPHILTLIDSGAADGLLYYVMPFVRGESLRDRLKREGQLGLDEALDITKQITSALDYAHRQGVVHRDIKPENILIHEGEAVLTDFGIAMAVQEAGGSRLTQTGLSLGTPQYMSPEQATGDRTLDSRSDVYSMGAVVYEMLAGEPPHTGPNMQAIIAKLMTERPTRLRVIRDTVPEEVDAAVAKALAKLPVDRFANTGDFARALATPGVRGRVRPRIRRWVPIAIGGAVVTAAAIAAAMILTRRGGPSLQPDRVQLTVTGLSEDASLSPDGTRIAFEEKQCAEPGYCTSQLVIQDIEGQNRQVLTGNVANFFSTAWTSDSRYVVFAASYGSKEFGVFAISTLGGERRFLGRGSYDLLSGDTAVIAMRQPGDSIGWVRRITVSDGQTLDSIPVRDLPATSGFDVIRSFRGPGIRDRSTSPDRLLIRAGEMRLIDFRGAVIDSVTPQFGSLGRGYFAGWVPARQKLIVSSQRAGFSTEFDILSMDVTASRIGQGIDTVVSGLQMGFGVFDVAPDGERLVYSDGPIEGTLLTIDPRPTKEGRFAATQKLSTTTRLTALISPSGDRIVVVREIPTPDGNVSDFSIVPRDGGAESRIARGVQNLLDFNWSSDGAAILYLHRVEGNKVQLMEIDTTGRRPREIARLEQSAAVAFYPLPDGALCIIPEDRRALSLTHRPGKADVTWRAPDWMGAIISVSLSPDTKSLALLGTTRLVDSILVSTVEIDNGRFARLASIGAEWLGRVRWLPDGNITFDVYEEQGGMALYSIRPGGPTRRLGRFPLSDGTVSVSKDGGHMVASNYGRKSDVFMIRNFGKMLRR